MRFDFAFAVLVLLAACGADAPAPARSEAPTVTASAEAAPSSADLGESPDAPAPAHTVAVGTYDPEVMAMCEAGCAEHDVTSGDTVAQPGAKVGDLARCPVSGVAFEVQADQASVTVAGDTWYTCCAMCAGKLKENPGRFVRTM